MSHPLPAIQVDALPYAQHLRLRALGDIDLVVIHCTELPDLATAREYGERELYSESRTGNSGHFYIDRDGSVHDWVPLERIAHHTKGYNERSIGIELVNTGRWPEWLDSRHQAMNEPYPDAQIAALLSLLQTLRTLPNLRFIAGHEDLDTDSVPATDDPALLVRRKRDPGPLFPWQRVLMGIALQRLPGG